MILKEQFFLILYLYKTFPFFRCPEVIPLNNITASFFHPFFFKEVTHIALHIFKKASFALPLLLLLVCLTLLAPVSASAEASALDIVRITIAPDNLWDPVTGLFAEGEAIDKSEFPFKNAVYRAQSDSVRKATLEYFPAGSDRIHGK